MRVHHSYLILLVFITSSCSTTKNTPGTAYQCPMRCEAGKTYDKPRLCPVCKMDLHLHEKFNTTTSDSSKDRTSHVQIAGEMRNVMHKGELSGIISLDTISNKTHLYGLGPVEYLTGEILIIDGQTYKTTVVNSTSMNIERTWQVKAPFFVYANVAHWKEITLPDNIQTIPQLESYIDNITKDLQRPFVFRVTAAVESADIHIVNLPEGVKVSSPTDVHNNHTTYSLKNEQVEIVGFFSTEHQGVFTHHDSFVHMHLITADKTRMGHLDKVIFQKGTAKLFVSR